MCVCATDRCGYAEVREGNTDVLSESISSLAANREPFAFMSVSHSTDRRRAQVTLSAYSSLHQWSRSWDPVN